VSDFAGASIVVTLRGYQLDVAVQLPPELENTGVSGLQGNYNGVASDDLLSRTGETLDASSDEETIHHQFGETCE